MSLLEKVLGYDENSMSVGPNPHDNNKLDQLPGVGIPDSGPWTTKEAMLVRPYSLGKEKRMLNYPMLSKVLAAPKEEEEVEIEIDPNLEVDPEGEPEFELEVEEEPPKEELEEEVGGERDEGEREILKAENFKKLDIETPEDFATKYQGKIEEMAEEHGIGDVLGYSFRTEKIELIGSEKILLLDYDLNALHTRDMFMV